MKNGSAARLHDLQQKSALLSEAGTEWLGEVGGRGVGGVGLWWVGSGGGRGSTVAGGGVGRGGEWGQGRRGPKGRVDWYTIKNRSDQHFVSGKPAPPLPPIES